MNSSKTPTIERLNEVFRYDPETGVLYWKKKTGNKVRVGKVAGSIRKGGKKRYLHLSIDKKFLLVHRIAWAITYGQWPDEVDHVNGNGLDNRISNLRNVTRRENGMNCRRSDNNTSGATGVVWLKSRNQWKAVIKVHQRNVFLGQFVDKDEAIVARRRAEVEYGFHPNHGSDRPD